jgi:hypothetical protein
LRKEFWPRLRTEAWWTALRRPMGFGFEARERNAKENQPETLNLSETHWPKSKCVWISTEDTGMSFGQASWNYRFNPSACLPFPPRRCIFLMWLKNINN